MYKSIEAPKSLDRAHTAARESAVVNHQSAAASQQLDTRRPILLLHGFGSTPRSMAPLGLRLRRLLGRKIALVQLGGRRSDLRENARRVDEILDQLSGTPGFEYADLVGHSMGGLISTHVLKCIDRGRRVRSVITLGAPHCGAPLAALGARIVAGTSRALEQMSPGSDFLEELKWMPVPSGCQLLSISGSSDQLVPPRCAQLTPLSGQRSLALAGVGHQRLAFASAVLHILYDTLGRRAEASMITAEAA
jgi:pimeloyl-ACP methyl ester carboxylesterase